MKRFVVPLVIGGSLTVLVALLLLLRSITSTEPSEPVATVPARERPVGSAPTTSMPTTPASGTPTPVFPAAPANTGERMPALPAGQSGIQSAGSDDAPPGTKLNTKNLHLGMPALREKIAGNTSQIASCVAGKRSSGEIMVTFIAGNRANRIEIEQTDIDGETTTIDDQPVLDCMMAATRSIRLDGLPREAEAIMVYRSISLQDGKITDDKPTKFSYIR